MAEAEAADDEERSSEDDSGANTGIQVPAVAACSLAMLLVLLLSGGLVMGTGPFQRELVRRFGYTKEESADVVAGGLQLFVACSAPMALAVDLVGPRLCAALGLLLASVGHAIVSQAAVVSHSTLGNAYGLVGIGGNLVMYGSVHFCMLVEHSGTFTAAMTAAYNSTGFVTMLLSFVHLEILFSMYAFLGLFSFAIVLVCYPDSPYEAPQQLPRICMRVKLPADCKIRLHDLFGGFRDAIRAPRTWLFFASYAWSSSTSNWGLSKFFIVAGDNERLIDVMPLLTQTSFLFAPCLGALIDAKGFTLPALSLGFWGTIFPLMLWSLPVQDQWLSLVALNILMTHVYGIQFSYIAETYPLTQFGMVMALSVLAQSVVNPLFIYLDVNQGSRIFALGSMPLCLMWAFVQWRHRLAGDETADQGDSDETAGVELSTNSEMSLQ